MPVVSLLFHDVFATDPRESGFQSPAADRYKLSVAEFDAQLDNLASLRIPDPRLTFDDGGVSYYTHAADRLEGHGWRGHCFITTDCIGRPGFLTVAQARELDRRGHIIGSHTASHPARISTLPAAAIRAEWRDSRK